MKVPLLLKDLYIELTKNYSILKIGNPKIPNRVKVRRTNATKTYTPGNNNKFDSEVTP